MLHYIVLLSYSFIRIAILVKPVQETGYGNQQWFYHHGDRIFVKDQTSATVL